MGRCRAGERSTRVGRSARRTRHSRGLPAPGGPARIAMRVERLRVPALPATRRVFADHGAAGEWMTTLNQRRPGQQATVISLGGEPGLVQRLYELGLIEGEMIEVLALAPLGDPIE